MNALLESLGIQLQGDALLALRLVAALAAIYALSIAGQVGFIRAMQRTPVGSALSAGGWVALAVGAAVGPRGIGLLNTEVVLMAEPVMVVLLAWIGLIIGLQARRAILQRIPAVLWKWSLSDAALSLALAIAAATVLRVYWFDPHQPSAAWTTLTALALFGALVGWSPETRSLGAGLGAAKSRTATLVHAGGGMAAIAAAFLSAPAIALLVRNADGSLALAPQSFVTALFISCAFGLFLAVGARVLLRQAGGDEATTWLILLATVALAGGVAATTGFSPITAGAICGLTMANLRGELRPIERVIAQSEPAVSTALFVLAGTLVRTPDSSWAWGVALALVGARALLKPACMAACLSDQQQHLDLRGPLLAAPMRQSALAVAIGVTLCIEEGGQFLGELLGLVVIAGAGSSLLAMGVVVLARPRLAT